MSEVTGTGAKEVASMEALLIGWGGGGGFVRVRGKWRRGTSCVMLEGG